MSNFLHIRPPFFLHLNTIQLLNSKLCDIPLTWQIAEFIEYIFGFIELNIQGV